jgi:hypothetical protein
VARNFYDVLAVDPDLEEEKMVLELESLARKLVASGRMRIDAGEYITFVRFSIPHHNIYRVFSWRELHDAHLQASTLASIKQELAKEYQGETLEKKARSEFKRLQDEIAKHLKLDPEIELKLARAFVQAAHPSVIMLILWEEVDVFLSFSHNIGDVLDIESWQTMGTNSGMQSTSMRHYAIYVSANGNPFLPENYVGGGIHGRPALARIMIIAAQEIGHFADIRRDASGRPVDRHSADIGVRRAKDHVRQGRHKDIAHAKKVGLVLQKCGLDKAVEAEKAAIYYEKHRKGDLIHKRSEIKARRLWKKFCRKASRKRLKFIHKFPDFDRPASFMQNMVGDMLFNLSPVADVYRSDDPHQEEAIACAEALARVPQQVIKWGHHTTIFMYPHLYRIYYGQVIPACVQTLETLTGNAYRFSYTRKKKILIFRWMDAVWFWLLARFRREKKA